MTTVQDVERAIEAAQHDVERTQARIERMRWVRDNIAELIDGLGVTLSESMYDYYGTQVVVNVPEVEGREWPGLDGTAGVIYRVRKALGIDKLSRETYTVGETTSTYFYGSGKLDDTDFSLHIRVGSQLPPSCRVEFVEETVTETRRVAKVICG